MESIYIMKLATTVKKKAEKVQRQKSFFFPQIQCAFIQCIAWHTGTPLNLGWELILDILVHRFL